MNIVRTLQLRFSARLTSWAQYMAPGGQKRQDRWNKMGWVKLAFEGMRSYKRGMQTRFPKTAGTPHACCMQWMTWIDGRRRQEERAKLQRQKSRQRLRQAIETVVVQVRHQNTIRKRREQRGDRICARTRGAECATRRDYSEKRRNKTRIGHHEQYPMHPLAHTDKIGSHAWATLTRLVEA
mgnify:CR=1 FL=1